MRLLLLGPIVAFGIVSHASDRPSVCFDFASLSKYVWRGLTVLDSPVFQPSVCVDYRGFSLGFWSNVEVSTSGAMAGAASIGGNPNELDLSISYSTTIAGSTITGGLTRYEFPNTGDSGYFEGTIGLELWGLPVIEASFDTASKGVYLRASVGRELASFQVARGTGLVRTAGWIGWGSDLHNRYWFASNDGGFTDWGMEVSAPITIGDWTLSPSLMYCERLKSSAAVLGKKSNVVFGVTLSFSY